MRASPLIIGLAVLLAGCVPAQVHEQTKRDLDKAKEVNADLVKKYNRAVQEIADLQKELAGRQDPKALLARIQSLEADKDRLEKQLAASPRFDPKDIKDMQGARLDKKGGVELGSALLFAEGSNALKPEALRTLDQVVDLLKTKYKGEMIFVEGHTDDQELKVTKDRWGTNMNLGFQRAYAVFEYFFKNGIPEPMMRIYACSYSDPVDPQTQTTEDGRRQNRRVVVRRGGAKF